MNAYKSFALVLMLFSVFMISASALSVTLTPSNTALDVGQIEVFNAVTSGGTGPYTYNYFNVTSSTLIISVSNASASNTLTFTSVATGSFSYNVVVTDNTPATANSVPSAITVNPALTALSTALYPNGATQGNAIDANQPMKLQTTFSGGTSPYTCNIVIAYSSNSAIIYNDIFPTGSSPCGNTFSSLPVGNLYAYTSVTDSATTNVEQTSANAPFTVAPVLGTPTFSSQSASGLDIGQNTTLAFSAVGGTPPYTYNFIISDYIGGPPGPIVAYSGPLSNSLTTNSFTYKAMQTGSFITNVVVTDSASIPVTVNSLYSPVGFSVENDPVVSLIPNNPSFDLGQTITYNIIVTNGINPYKVELYNVTGSKQQGSNVIIYTNGGGSNTISFTAGSAGTFQYKAIVTDSASSPYTVISATNTINVAPSVSLSASNALLDIGQTETLSAAISGGSAPYTVNFIYTNNGIVANTVVTSASPATFTFNPSAAGTFTYNVVVTDSTPTTFNSLPISTTYYTSPNISISSLTNTILDQGQLQTAILAITGGSGSFLTNVTGAASPTAPIIAAEQAGRNVTVSFVEGFYSTTPGSAVLYWFATDTGTTTPYAFSTKRYYTVVSQPIIDITPSLLSLTQGQSESLAVRTYNALGAALTNYNIKVVGPSGQVGGTLTGNGTISFKPQANASYTLQFTDANTVLNYTRVLYLPSNAMLARSSILTINASLPSGYPLYICAGADGNTGIAPSWTQDSNAVFSSLYPMLPGSSIGHQSNSLCTFTQNTVVNGAGKTALAGIAMFNTSKYTLFNSNSTPGGTAALSLNYTVSTSGSFTVLGVACGDLECRTIRMPSGCVTQQYVNTTDTSAAALLAVCPSQSAGTYQVNESSPSGSGSRASMAAYVFTKAPLMFKVAANTSGGSQCGSSGCATGGGVPNTTSTTVTTTTTTTALSTTTIHQINVTGSHINVTINITANGTALNLNNGEILLELFSNRSGPANVLITKLSIPTIPPAPANFTELAAFEVNVSRNMTPKPHTNVTMVLQYNCSVPSTRVIPFILVNGNWTQAAHYSVNASACTAEFTIPVDPTVALFEAPAYLTTTIATTTTASTSIPLPSSSGNAGAYIIAAIIVVIVVIAIAYGLSRRKPGLNP